MIFIMKIIKSIFFRLGGADYDVIKNCSKRTRFRYLCLALALILATVLAFIGGFDIAHQFTPVLYINLGVAILWGLITFSYDYFIVNGAHGGGFLKYLRIIVGLANIIITIAALFVLMNQARIDSQITLDNSEAIKTLDDEYLRAREVRYKAVTEKKAAAEKYNSEVVLPEARRGYPGPKYEEKKAAYDVMIGSTNAETEKLNTAEEPYLSAYQAKRTAIVSITSNDFFSKVRMLPQVLQSGGWASILLAICLFIFLSYVDLQAISIKLSMSDNDEYHKAEKAHEELLSDGRQAGASAHAAMHRRRVLLDHREEEQKLNEQEHQHSMTEVDDRIVREAEIRGKISVLRKKGYDVAATMLEAQLEALVNSPSAANFTRSDRAKADATADAVTVEEILRLSGPMCETLAAIRSAFTSDQLVSGIFDWIVQNIQYDKNHGKFFYRTARETYNDGHGICGELAVVYMAFLRACGIRANFVEVSEDDKGENVAHACVLVNDGQESFLSDPAYRSFKIEHPQWVEWSDEKLLTEYESWNK